jgi:hypothetical protein
MLTVVCLFGTATQAKQSYAKACKDLESSTLAIRAAEDPSAPKKPSEKDLNKVHAVLTIITEVTQL